MNKDAATVTAIVKYSKADFISGHPVDRFHMQVGNYPKIKLIFHPLYLG